MSNKALNWAWDARIPPGPKFVLVAMADHAGDHRGEDWSCFPAVDRLMEFTSQSNATVRRHIDWLVEDGWISKDRRNGRARDDKDGVFLFTLHRARGDAGGPLNLSGDEGGEDRSNRAVDKSEDRSKRAVEHRSNEGPAPLISGVSTAQNEQSPCTPYIAEPPINPQEPSACVSARSAAFEKLGEGWAKAAPGRFSRPKGWAAFEAACDGGHDPDFLAGCGLRFLAESRDAKAGRTPMLHGWLADERWVGFEPVEAGGGGAALAARFDGPADFVAAARIEKDAAWIGSYLSPASWDGEARCIVALNGYAAGQLQNGLRRSLEQFKITVRKPG